MVYLPFCFILAAKVLQNVRNTKNFLTFYFILFLLAYILLDYLLFFRQNDIIIGFRTPIILHFVILVEILVSIWSIVSLVSFFF